jgi:hypothetical protein
VLYFSCGYFTKYPRTAPQNSLGNGFPGGNCVIHRAPLSNSEGCQKGSANASPVLRATEPLFSWKVMFVAAASPQGRERAVYTISSASQMPLKKYLPFPGG